MVDDTVSFGDIQVIPYQTKSGTSDLSTPVTLFTAAARTRYEIDITIRLRGSGYVGELVLDTHVFWDYSPQGSTTAKVYLDNTTDTALPVKLQRTGSSPSNPGATYNISWRSGLGG